MFGNKAQKLYIEHGLLKTIVESKPPGNPQLNREGLLLSGYKVAGLGLFQAHLEGHLVGTLERDSFSANCVGCFTHLYVIQRCMCIYIYIPETLNPKP